MGAACAADTARPAATTSPFLRPIAGRRNRCWLFCPGATPETTREISTYVTPPSGESRRLISLVFSSWCGDWAECACTMPASYVFHRRWLEIIDLHSVRAARPRIQLRVAGKMRQAGSRFASVTIRPFVREVDKPRSGPAPDCAVFGEIARYRMRAFTSALSAVDAKGAANYLARALAAWSHAGRRLLPVLPAGRRGHECGRAQDKRSRTCRMSSERTPSVRVLALLIRLGKTSTRS